MPAQIGADDLAGVADIEAEELLLDRTRQLLILADVVQLGDHELFVRPIFIPQAHDIIQMAGAAQFLAQVFQLIHQLLALGFGQPPDLRREDLPRIDMCGDQEGIGLILEYPAFLLDGHVFADFAAHRLLHQQAVAHFLAQFPFRNPDHPADVLERLALGRVVARQLVQRVVDFLLGNGDAGPLGVGGERGRLGPILQELTAQGEKRLLIVGAQVGPVDRLHINVDAQFQFVLGDRPARFALLHDGAHQQPAHRIGPRDRFGPHDRTVERLIAHVVRFERLALLVGQPEVRIGLARLLGIAVRGEHEQQTAGRGDHRTRERHDGQNLRTERRAPDPRDWIAARLRSILPNRPLPRQSHFQLEKGGHGLDTALRGTSAI
ncbi:MAG: hypothetical protein BWZ08_02075 [candidate division BRC1 bacterium ADurb.BinA292]|nr:MAG: hypothetical protein BWZ08_02075 [candidate division BRC1 bacterium ADurb.BinA292]